MFYIIFKKLFIFIVPAVVLVFTWFLSQMIATLPPGQEELVLLSPYLLTALGMFLSVHFHRGRPFIILILLIVFYWCSNSFLPENSFEPAINKLYQAFVLFFPVNLVLIAFMHERGLFSTAGRLRFIFLAAEGIFIYWLFHYNFDYILPYIACNYSFLPFLKYMFVPAPAILNGLLCFFIILLLAVHRKTPVESAILGALTAFFVASNWLNDNNIHTLFCSSGAAIITLSVLRDSYNMAFRDDLTGLPSRRSLNETLQGLGRNYAIAMLDVDHFKKFNDTYGHDVGDQVLKMVAQQMMEVTGGGKAYRYGGEEFTILFPGCQASNTIAHLEELRKNIAEYKLAIRGESRPKDQKQGKTQRGNQNKSTSVSVTISIGVAERSEKLTTTEEVMKAADKALYKAKNLGRNQVSC